MWMDCTQHWWILNREKIRFFHLDRLRLLIILFSFYFPKNKLGKEKIIKNEKNQ